MVSRSTRLGSESDCAGNASSTCTSKLQIHPQVRDGAQYGKKPPQTSVVHFCGKVRKIVH
jgi:hypothetical protein